MKHSAGIFLYNEATGRFLIVHPAGAYNRKAPWHIPKGEISQGQDPLDAGNLKEEAVRELKEETGIELPETAEPFFLGSRRYKSGSKTIHAFFCRISSPEDPEVRLDRENDRFLWARLDELETLLHEAQKSFTLDLIKIVGGKT